MLQVLLLSRLHFQIFPRCLPPSSEEDFFFSIYLDEKEILLYRDFIISGHFRLKDNISGHSSKLTNFGDLGLTVIRAVCLLLSVWLELTGLAGK